MTSNRRFPKSRLFIVELPIVGLFILALVGWVYWLALKEWKRRKEYPYAGAVAIIGFIGVTAFIVAMGFSVAHVFRSAHIAKERTDCVRNLNSMGRAMLMYQSDNNDRMPGANWSESLTKYMDPLDFGCPLLKPYGYTMSERIIGRETSEFFSPARTVAAFDGTGGKDSVGDDESIVYRHYGSAIILYLDGHTRTENKEMFEGLVGE